MSSENLYLFSRGLENTVFQAHKQIRKGESILKTESEKIEEGDIVKVKRESRKILILFKKY